MADTGRMRLEIRLLGGFRMAVDGKDVPAEAWSRRNAAAILKILALSPGYRIHREQMMEHLWPETDPRQAVNNLYQAMHAARRALDTAVPGAGQALLLQDHVIQFAPEIEVWVDTGAFNQAASGAAGDSSALQDAIGLYQGSLLPDDRYESWASEAREHLHQQYLGVLEDLAAMRESDGNFQGALALLRKLVAAEPLHEPAYVALMRIHAATGQRQQAIRVYQSLTETLERELEIQPAPETQQLYTQILSGEVAPPALRSDMPLDSSQRRDNLPSPVNAFIGREREKAEVRRLLRGTRLLTLTGPGGCGKSRLSLEVAAGEIEQHADGVWLVELASLSDSDLVPQAIARSLGIREMPAQPLINTLTAWFRNRDLLLILDNCEHLIDACAALVELLLRAAPSLTILATSREPLRIDGETTWLVPSLSLPDPAAVDSTAELMAYESVQLFVDRAGRVLPGFSLRDDDARPVAVLCYRLDGIPLAIELAASRVRAMPVAQIVARLDDRFQLLSGGIRTALSRQQTLRATLDWSYNLLNEREQVLFSRLSVFSGGFDLQAVEDICAAPPLEQGEILHLLMLLVDRSLVVASSEQGTGRYTLLETMREYGRERLKEHGEAAATAGAHASYYAALARQAADRIRGADQRIWLGRLERDHDNLRQALDWYESQAEEVASEEVLLLAGDLYWFWHLHGHYSEGRNRLSRLLDVQRPAPSRGFGTALTGAGAMYLVIGEYAQAHAYLNDSIAVWRELGDLDGLTSALSWSGWIELFLGSIAVARERHTEALDLATRIGDDWEIAKATMGLGFDATEADEHEEAFRYFERALEIFQSTNDYWGTTTALQQLANLTYRTGNFRMARQRALEVLALERAEGDRWLEIQSQSLLGEISRAEQDYEAAAESVEISLAMAAELGHVAMRAWTLRDAGYIALATGDLHSAIGHLLESLAMFRDRSYPLGIACCLAGLAGVAVEQGEPVLTARILGSVHVALGSMRMALAPADRLAVERFIGAARSRLGGSAFERAWEHGASQSLDASIQQAEAYFGAK